MVLGINYELVNSVCNLSLSAVLIYGIYCIKSNLNGPIWSAFYKVFVPSSHFVKIHLVNYEAL